MNENQRMAILVGYLLLGASACVGLFFGMGLNIKWLEIIGGILACVWVFIGGVSFLYEYAQM